LCERDEKNPILYGNHNQFGLKGVEVGWWYEKKTKNKKKKEKNAKYKSQRRRIQTCGFRA
jgi:hypothetical protein